MQGNVLRLSDLSHACHRVYGAVGIFRCTGQYHHRVAVNEFAQLFQVRSEILLQRHQSDLHAKVFRRLEPGHVGRLRQDHLRFTHPALVSRHVAVGLYRHQAALRAARSHHATNLFGTVKYVGGGADHLIFQLLEALERPRIQAIFRGIAVIGIFEEAGVLLVQVVDQAPHPPLFILRVTTLEGLQALQDVLTGCALLGHWLVHGNSPINCVITGCAGTAPG